jgi:hypothetical protein
VWEVFKTAFGLYANVFSLSLHTGCFQPMLTGISQRRHYMARNNVILRRSVGRELT